MPFSAEQLIVTLNRLAPGAAGYWVAYSGGLDSHVLLHALAAVREQLSAPLTAVHVNHNLQAAAADWETHCRGVCSALGVEYRSCSVDARPSDGESPEAAARVARYRVLAEALPAGHVLLTAHHQDDQAETLLLQLLRGAGPKGLAAMPLQAPLGETSLLRPLLEVNRAALLAYAQQHQLDWVDDPSNAVTDYDRNFLRHDILPMLRTRWPSVTATLARSARHQAETAQLLAELAVIDAGQTTVSASTKTCSVPSLLALSTARRANLLRHWLQQCGVPLPSTAVMARIETDLLHCAADAQPLVSWADVRLRRYRDRLYLDDVLEEADPNRCLDWSLEQCLCLPGGTLSAVRTHGDGIALRYLQDGPLQVRFRQGGEVLQPAGRREHHSLKHLFQEAGVPPWERARVPLIYRGDTLLAVAGYWVSAACAAQAGAAGVRMEWCRWNNRS